MQSAAPSHFSCIDTSLAVPSLPSSLSSQPSHSLSASQNLVPTQPHGRLPQLLQVWSDATSQWPSLTTTESSTPSAPSLAVESPSHSAVPDIANCAVSVPLQAVSSGRAGTCLLLCPQVLEQGLVQRRPQILGGFLVISCPVVVSACLGSLAEVYCRSFFWEGLVSAISHESLTVCHVGLFPGSETEGMILRNHWNHAFFPSLRTW